MKDCKVLFCDLDGTLIETISEETFPKGIWDMKFKFDVLDAIKKLAPEYIFIVSNQGGISMGYVDSIGFKNKFEYILDAIEEYCGIKTDGLYCESNDEHHNRKPHVGMLFTLCQDYTTIDNHILFTKENMIMIGDASGLEGQFSDTDKKTAENFGIDYLDVNEFVKLMK